MNVAVQAGTFMEPVMAQTLKQAKMVSIRPYAYAVKPGDGAWLDTLDQFVQRVQRDGRLDVAARRHGLAEIVVR